MTKIDTSSVCKACNSLGVTSPAGKAYRKLANAVAPIPCKACTKPTGFVKAKIRAAKLKAAPVEHAVSCKACNAKARANMLGEAAPAPRKAKVETCPELAWITIAGQEFMIEAPKSGMARVPQKVSRKTRKASPTTQSTRTRTVYAN